MRELEDRVIRRIFRRIIPFLMLCYFFAFLDRVNLGFAALDMNRELSFDAAVFGLGAGIFFLGYLLFEVPSSLMQHRFGARRWIAGIIVCWGIVSTATAFIGSVAWISAEAQFYLARFLLGVAEAGFFPGVIYYITLWFPEAYRGRIFGLFFCTVPLSSAIGAPISSAILVYMEGVAGLHGWQWIFVLEAVPAILLGAVTWFYLTDEPSRATWLDKDARSWLVQRLFAEQDAMPVASGESVLKVISNPKVVSLGIAGMGFASGIYTIGFFLPQVVQEFSATHLRTGVITAIPFLVGGLATIWYGWHSDRRCECRNRHAALAFVVGAIGLAAAAFANDPLTRMASICVAAFGIFAVLPVFWALPATFLSGRSRAIGIAFITTIASVAGIIGPWAFGVIRSMTGRFDNGFLLIAATMLVSAVLVLQIGPSPRRVAEVTYE